MEIIPKTVSELPKWFNILFYVSLGILFLSLIVILVLNILVNKANKDLADLDAALAGLQTEERIKLEADILDVQRRIKDYSFLLDQHLQSSEAFTVLQKNCHPFVYFNQFSLTSRDGKVSVSGKAKSFEVLGQQTLVLKKNTDFENIELSQMAINKEGGVDFNLTFNFKEGLLNY